MAEPVHTHENDALEAVKNLHRGYSDVASKLLIAHVVSDTIEILDSAKSPKLRTEEQRLRNAIAGKDIHAEKQKVRLELTKISGEITIKAKSEAEIQQDIKSLETIHEPIISANVELIVQLADLKRSAKNARAPRPTPTPPITPPHLIPPPLPPLVPHAPAVGPNIISNSHITISSLPHSESIRGTVQIGETLHLSKDGISWTPVTTDARGNFNIPISENTNGTYTYTLKTRTVAGLESSEESVSIVIAAVLATSPTGPTITSPATFTVDTPTIEGSTTPGSDVEVIIDGVLVGTGIADGAGNYSVRTSAIAAGTHTVTVKVINPADTTKVSQSSQIIQIVTPLSLGPVSVDAGSMKIEKLTPNPAIMLENTVIGARVRITDAATGRLLSDEIVRRHDAGGKFRVNLKGFDVRAVGPQDITIETIDPSDPSNTESNDQTLEITEKKIKFTHPPKAALTKPGKQENNRNLTINLDDIIPGTKIQVENSRITGGKDEFYANGKTFSQNIYNIDTTAPSTGPEELIIRMVDPHDPSNKSAEFRLPFEIDYPVLAIERPEIASISDKLNHGDDIKFQMSNAVDQSELIITGPGLSTAKRMTVPAGNGSDFEIDLGIKAVPPLQPGKSYEYSIVAEDPKHPGTKKITKVKIEIDHPVLTLATPTISNATPVEVRQGAPSKGFLTINNAVIGAEYSLVLPNGTEIPSGKATGPTHTVSLNNVDINTPGAQTVFIKVKDPHHDTVAVLQSSVDLEIKKKLEAPKHLPQPVFRTPADYAEGSGDIDIELLNTVTSSEVTVEYDTAGGRTTTAPLTVTADGNLKLPLAGFDAPAGTSNVRVIYRNPVTGVSNARDISMHIAPRPDIERPEGLQDETDINTKPFDVKIGKIKPGQTISITGNTEMSGGAASIPAVLRNNGGTWILNIPAGAQSIKQNYTVRITDTVTGTIEDFPIVVNVKVPPKSNLRVDHHNFIHSCEEAKRLGTGSYRINGEPRPFSVTKSWGGKYKTSVVLHGHGEEFKAKTPEDLYKAVKEHLDHHNQHETDEYNAYWGLMPETPEHKKDDSHETEGKEKGKDKEGGHDKGDHGDHGSESGDHGHSLYDKGIEKIFGHGLIGKTFIGVKNLIPEWIRNSSSGLTKSAITGGIGGAAVAGGLMGASYLGLTGIGVVAASSFFWPAAITIGGVTGAKKLYKWWKGGEKSAANSGGH